MYNFCSLIILKKHYLSNTGSVWAKHQERLGLTLETFDRNDGNVLTITLH